MKKVIKKYFIPHKENNYLPHILHTKRTIFYGVVFLLMKAMVFVFALAIPSYAFMLPQVLEYDEQNILQITNKIRNEADVSPLNENAKLNNSALMKVTDMATKSYFSHKNEDGLGLAYFLYQAGYSYSLAGENLAMGFTNVDELFDAWKRSPTHYANLVEGRFIDAGISLAFGEYNGVPTVYVVQHFGKPKKIVDTSAVSTNTETATPPKEVLGQKDPITPQTMEIEPEYMRQETLVLSETEPSVFYSTEDSYLSWEQKGSAMLISANIKALGDVASAGVYVNEYFIPLQKIKNNEYIGSLEVQEKPEEFFRVVLPGVLKIVDSNKNLFEYGVGWRNALIVGPTPMEKYTAAQKSLSPLNSVNNVFAFSKNIYLGFLVFFAFVLAINILVEIRKQHYHIILKTCGLIAVLVLMIVI